jgi:hypothetical protein
MVTGTSYMIRGVREHRAKVFGPKKVAKNLVCYLEQKIEKAREIKQCSLLADLAIILYLWGTWS